MIQDLNEKIIQLEIKSTHQDNIIEELNLALYTQQKRMDQLEKLIFDLKKRITSETNNEIEIRQNEKPPHY